MDHTTKPDTDPDAQLIEYPAGEAHGVTVTVQLDDGNALYDTLTDAQRRLNNERGTNADADNPHTVGEIDASWTDGVDEIDFFSSGARYGVERDGGFTQFYKQHLKLNESGRHPAKRSVRVHKRSSDLVYQDGNEFTWPAGWLTGDTHEGTCLEIHASYADSPGEVVAHALELIEASGLVSPAELREVKRPIQETLYIRGLESHHRIHDTHERDAIDTLRDTGKLLGAKGDGQIQAEFEKGHHQLWGVESTRMDFLGFETGIEWEYAGQEFTDTVDKHYLKVYRHKNAGGFAKTDPRAHPKIEVKAPKGAYPGPAWPALKDHLDTILNAHTADFAGVPEAGLVADDHHDGADQETTITPSPTDYRVNLRDYFQSHGFAKDVISLLVNNRSNAAKDILYTVIRLDRPVPYGELSAETGLTKSTLRKWVSRMEDMEIVERFQSGQMFVAMSDFAREHLRRVIDVMKPVGDTKAEIRERRDERIEARESDEPTTPATHAVATDGGTERTPNTPDDTNTDHAPHTPPHAAADTTPPDRPPD